MNRFLPKDKAAQLLHKIQEEALPAEYEPVKHRLTLTDEAGNGQVYFRLPITLPYPLLSKPEHGTQVNYVMLLIQSGSCAVGYFENGRNLDHKVYRSYMVRKKQGKSQIKYLKTKGKSRAGSRVRLGETIEFFENINGRLQTYFQEHQIHRIAISCSKTLIPYLFGSKVETPFSKNDPRIYKIPRHIHTPVYEVMLDANKFLLRGELVYEEAQQRMADNLLLKAGITLTDETPFLHETEESYEADEMDEEAANEDNDDEWY